MTTAMMVMMGVMRGETMASVAMPLAPTLTVVVVVVVAAAAAAVVVLVVAAVLVVVDIFISVTYDRLLVAWRWLVLHRF